MPKYQSAMFHSGIIGNFLFSLCGQSKGSYGHDSHLDLVGLLTTHVWVMYCYGLYIKSSAQCSGLQGCRSAEAGGVAASRTEAEMAAGAKRPGGRDGLAAC